MPGRLFEQQPQRIPGTSEDAGHRHGLQCEYRQLTIRFAVDFQLQRCHALAGRYRILLITKGDLFDQERKLAQSGLGDYFSAVEIVSDKTPGVYERIFTRHGDGPQRAVMVGNSLKSDVVPAIRAGSWGVYVPHDLTWVLEHEEAPEADPRFRRIADLGQLPDLLSQMT